MKWAAIYVPLGVLWGWLIGSLIAGIVFAAVALIAIGWSTSRGPARRSLERRIQRRDSN
jgi:uncharacterized protein (DUF2062 family)